MIDLPEGGEGNGARSGIGWRDIEGPQEVEVERMWEALGVGESEGGELGIWISLGGGHQVFPAIDAASFGSAAVFSHGGQHSFNGVIIRIGDIDVTGGIHRNAGGGVILILVEIDH